MSACPECDDRASIGLGPCDACVARKAQWDRAAAVDIDMPTVPVSEVEKAATRARVRMLTIDAFGFDVLAAAEKRDKSVETTRMAVAANATQTRADRLLAQMSEPPTEREITKREIASQAAASRRAAIKKRLLKELADKRNH